MRKGGRLALAAVAVPLAAKALRGVGRSMRARRGSSPTVPGLDAYSASRSYGSYPR